MSAEAVVFRPGMWVQKRRSGCAHCVGGATDRGEFGYLMCNKNKKIDSFEGTAQGYLLWQKASPMAKRCKKCEAAIRVAFEGLRCARLP